MFIHTEKLDYNKHFHFIDSYQKVTLWDIETLGLSYDKPIVIIGFIILNPKEKEATLFQGIIEKREEEKSLIEWFINNTLDSKLFIHFNGSRFDRPFLEKRCEFLNLNIPALLPEIDLYKEYKKHKQLLNLNKFAQKSIETFLNIQREDILNGKELIQVTYQFLENPNPNLLKSIKTHNIEDAKGMYQLIDLLDFFDFLKNPKFMIISNQMDKDAIYIDVNVDFLFPISHSVHLEDIHLRFFENTNLIKLKIIISKKEMYYFFNNYKDYYYLPLEDFAIHKSIAAYVDSSFKKKATASTCYQKFDGCFIPYQPIVSTDCYYADKEKKHPFMKIQSDTFFNIAKDYLTCFFKSLAK